MQHNVRAYDRPRAAPVYDAVIGPLSAKHRERAVAALELSPEDRLLISGIGTGLDLPLLPRLISGLGVDLSEGMLRHARERRARLGMDRFELRKMDAQELEFADESFDAIYLPLIVAVADDGARVLSEAARVAKPGARLVVADKFWPENRGRPSLVRKFSGLAGRYATHLDRRFSEVHAGAPQLEVLADEPLALGRYFRRILLKKPELPES